MTLDVYAGLFADDLTEVADRLDDLVPRDVPRMCPRRSGDDPNGDPKAPHTPPDLS